MKTLVMDYVFEYNAENKYKEKYVSYIGVHLTYLARDINNNLVENTNQTIYNSATVKFKNGKFHINLGEDFISKLKKDNDFIEFLVILDSYTIALSEDKDAGYVESEDISALDLFTFMNNEEECNQLLEKQIPSSLSYRLVDVNQVNLKQSLR